MLYHLDDLAQNNNHPSDEALSEVKLLLSEPWRRLEETDVEIIRLEALLQELKQKRTEFEQSINRYSNILAPIRRVPQDVLHTIFTHCLPTHRNPTMAASEPPMLLTQICRNWRSLAFASPRLWARIHIPFRMAGDMHNRYPDYPNIPSQTVSAVLLLRCQAVNEWLAHSGDCPLSISIYYVPDYHGFHSDWSDEISTFLLKTIAQFSSRWRFLELNIPLEAYCELETILSLHPLPRRLVHLRTSICGRASQLNLEPSLRLFESPNLRRISFVLPSTRGNNLLTERLHRYQNITHFTSQTLCSTHELINLLKACPLLVHVFLKINFANSIPKRYSYHASDLYGSTKSTKYLHL